MTDITLAVAKSIIAAAMAGANDKGLAAATVVVTDIGGAIRAAERSDKAGPFGADIARAKARTALGMRRSSIKTAGVFGDKPSIVTGLNAAVGGDFLPLGGGVVVIDSTGAILGGAALAGGAPDVDHDIITAAVVAAGLAILE